MVLWFCHSKANKLKKGDAQNPWPLSLVEPWLRYILELKMCKKSLEGKDEWIPINRDSKMIIIEQHCLSSFFSIWKRCKEGIEDTSENTATSHVLISLMACTLLQRTLGLSFGMKVLKSAKYLLQWESFKVICIYMHITQTSIGRPFWTSLQIIQVNLKLYLLWSIHSTVLPGKRCYLFKWLY